MIEPVIIFVPGEAVPFARSGGNGKRRYTPSKQRSAMQALGTYANLAMQGKPPLTGPLHLQLRATYLFPASWSQKKRAVTLWKTSRPDTDNIVKLAKDAMNKIVFQDDAQIVWFEEQKKYGVRASLVITVTPLEASL